MSQKSVLLTLRQNRHFLNLSNHSPKTFLYLYFFLIKFKDMLQAKNIIISNEFLNTTGNKIFLNANLLFSSSILKSYKKKKKHLKATSINIANNKISAYLQKYLFKKLNLFLKTNLIVLNFNILNHYISEEEINYFFVALESLAASVFPRKASLFVDFIKLTVLYRKSLISLDTYANALAKVFSGLHKKNHGKFTAFLNSLFELLYHEDSEISPFKDSLGYGGIKVILTGRLRGKAKASSEVVSVGIIPSHSINKDIDFAKARSYLPGLGVIGLKIWVYKQEKHQE
jgi:hypothetical protein